MRVARGQDGRTAARRRLGRASAMRVAAPGVWVALIAVVVALAGCAGVQPSDLFVVERSGPGGRLTLLVDEQGGLRCNGARKLTLSDPQLIQARAIQEDLRTSAGEHLSLPPRPGSVFAYRLRDESGSVSFADDSTGQPKVFRNLALFVLQVARQNCHLPQPGA